VLFYSAPGFEGPVAEPRARLLNRSFNFAMKAMGRRREPGPREATLGAIHAFATSRPTICLPAHEPDAAMAR
jgi:hypothetical protein